MRAKSWIGLAWAVIRLIAPAAVLFWLITAADDELLIPAQRGLGWLVLAVALNEAALALFGVRMQLLLRAFDVTLRWPNAFRIHVQSVFYFFIVPMTVGVELARFGKIRAAIPGTPTGRILPALLLDRMLGAGSAAALALLMWPFVRFDAAPWAEVSAGAVWIGLMALAAAAITLCIPPARRAVRQAWLVVVAKRRRVAEIFAFSMVMHCVFALAILAGAWAFAIDVSFPEVAFAVAGGMLLVAVPLSIGGLGAADVTTAAIFLAMGYTLEQSVLLGALPYLARLLAAVQGGVWEMLDGGSESIIRTRELMRRHAKPAETGGEAG